MSLTVPSSTTQLCLVTLQLDLCDVSSGLIWGHTSLVVIQDVIHSSKFVKIECVGFEVSLNFHFYNSFLLIFYDVGSQSNSGPSTC